MKKSTFIKIVFFVFFSCSAQPPFFVVYAYSTPGVDGNSVYIGSNEATIQVERKIDAHWRAQMEEYARQANRFDRKLILSSIVVAKMNDNYSKTSKYPQAKALYERSLENYKKLEHISIKAAEQVNKHQSIEIYQNEQSIIMQKALDDYHKAEDLIELGNTKKMILDEAAKNLIIDKNLSVAERGQLEEEIKKIKFAQEQIKKLNKNTDPLKRLQVDLERQQNYQSIAQMTVFLSKIIEKIIVSINPDKNGNKIVGISESIVEKYIEESFENGKSPSTAVSLAFQKGYEKLMATELLNAVSPIKELYKVPLLAENLSKEIQNWEKMEKKQREVNKQINNVLKFTEEGVRFNQTIIDRSIVKSDIIINNAINRYLKRSPM